jgi:hypothetical protein
MRYGRERREEGEEEEGGRRKREEEEGVPSRQFMVPNKYQYEVLGYFVGYIE